jgi:hypothetical protein
MGFVPIILTVSAAIFLFMMAVHHSLKSKKNQIYTLREVMKAGLDEFQINNFHFENNDLEELSKAFKVAKESLNGKEDKKFDELVRRPFREIKLISAQYNQLISRKPYSFVANLMGHQSI